MRQSRWAERFSNFVVGVLMFFVVGVLMFQVFGWSWKMAVAVTGWVIIAAALNAVSPP